MTRALFFIVILFFFSKNYSQNKEVDFSFKTKLPDTSSVKIVFKSINGLKTFQSKLPYPIVFIHGLNSSSETWNVTTNYFDTQYMFTFGGRFDFCLNADGNNTTTNKNFYPVSNADIIAFESSVQNGDYYYINFNVNPSGTLGTTVLSNQSAIAKQGAAIKVAIQRIMEITGKNKVVLVGHSMGGLASREYIQNSYNWQTDNYHHVAKLLCVGTPNGGSNASDSSLAYFTGTDLQSEAIRDLKSTYYYSGEPGRFLFGGIEVQNNTNMNDNSYTPHFYNVDINCNGILGETIVGLNQKPIDNFIDYSCVIGRITNFSGTNITTDGIVAEPSSNLNYYYPLLTYPAKLFYYNSGYDLIENHTELTSYYYQIMQGLDEPNVKELAYTVDTNKLYFGFTTVQNLVAADNDFYKFSITNSVNANVSITNITTSTMSASILDESGALIGTVQNSIGGSLNFSRALLAGNYFLKITSENPTNTNYQTPYQFTISSTLNTDFENIEPIVFYPNPVKDILYFDNINFTSATIFNHLGQIILDKILDKDLNNSLNLSELELGNYILVLKNASQERKIIKFVKE